MHCTRGKNSALITCAALPFVQVLDLPQRPVPMAPEVAMRPIPPAGYFLMRWKEIFQS